MGYASNTRNEQDSHLGIPGLFYEIDLQNSTCFHPHFLLVFWYWYVFQSKAVIVPNIFTVLVY